MDLPVDIVLAELADFEPWVVYLHGSQATGRARPDSDVDLAILGPRPLDPYARFLAAGRLATRLGRDVDLLDLRSASAVMRALVVTRGVRLWVGDPDRCAEHEMYALSDYARTSEERRECLGLFPGTPHA
jgi:predicted nucleotidyltransferase